MVIQHYMRITKHYKNVHNTSQMDNLSKVLSKYLLSFTMCCLHKDSILWYWLQSNSTNAGSES